MWHVDDCCDTSDWSEVYDTVDGTIAVENDDYFKITGTCDSVDSEYVAYEKNIPNGSSNGVKYYAIRYKTSASANGLGAHARIVFTSGDQDVALTSGNPSFSTTWKIEVGSITPDKWIDKLQLLANDYPDSVNSGTYKVYYDYFLVTRDLFQFPFISLLAKLVAPNRFADIQIPGRVTDVSQYLGAGNAKVTLYGDMELGSWGTPKSDKLLRLLHDMSPAGDDPWYLLLSDNPKLSFRVTVRKVEHGFEGGNHGKPGFRLELEEYRRSDGANESYSERFGLDGWVDNT